MTNRALRALELLGGDSSITPEEFDAYKYDVTYAETSEVAQAWRAARDARRRGDALTAGGAGRAARLGPARGAATAAPPRWRC